MNFKEYADRHYAPNAMERLMAKDAWDTCKTEVLKIIKNNLTTNTTCNNAFLDQIIDIDVIKKIEKL